MVVRIFCTRIVPIFIICIAIFVGWLSKGEVAMGRLFATLIPLVKGVLPPTIVGHGKMSGTPPVPDDMMPEPRPEKESLIRLVSGYTIPQSGIGMCCRPTAYDDVLVERTVLWYLLMGGRHIDGAHLYLNHGAIGNGIKEAIRRGVPRSEIFVTTKLFPSSFGNNTTKNIVPTFLEQLDLDYVDLLLMHSPVLIPGVEYMSQECRQLKLSNKECRQQTYKALSDLATQGLIRSVGVSNFVTSQLEELQEIDDGGTNAVAPIAINQIQYNPWAPKHWIETFNYCKQNNIVVTAYNSLGGIEHEKVTKLETLTEIAHRYNKTLPQIMLRWAIQFGLVIIPGTGNPKHMRENLAIYSFKLSNDDMNKINNLADTDSPISVMPFLE